MPIGHQRASPLRGVRVLDLSQVWAGPRCTKLLSDLGAEVIKVEHARRPDPNRGVMESRRAAAPTLMTEQEQRERSRASATEELNRNALGLSLDLATTDGKRLFLELVRVCDVVANNFSFGVMDRLGLGYDALREVRSDIIVIAMPAFGASGPWRDLLTYGAVLEAMAGISTLTGYPDSEVPTKSGANVGDPMNANHAAGAILAALLYRARTGRGTLIDFSQYESMVSVIGDVITDYTLNGRVATRQANRHPTWAPHGVYRCSGDDRWVAIAVTSDREWRALCQAMGQPALAEDRRFADAASRWRNQEQLTPIIKGWACRRSHYEAMQSLQQAGVPATALLDTQEVQADPHGQARERVVRLRHPDGVEHPYLSTPIHLSRTPPHIRAPAPLLGEHNRRILHELLGIPGNEVARLEASGVCATLTAPPEGRPGRG
ncbi:MAG: CoA transferase [Chloroflexi bacterium]|nr:CoA transferase [Chloroflexota bacterium]